MKPNPTRPMGGIFLLVSLWLCTAGLGADKALPACNRLRFEPLAGTEHQLAGAKLEGSNTSRTEGYVTLATIQDAPAAKTWTEVKFDNAKLYRWVRFSMPAGAKAKMGKVEVYSGERLLAGNENKGALFTPFAEGKDGVNDGAIGFDLFATATPGRPVFTPAEGDLDQPIDVKLSGPREAIIRYTLDGSTPTAEHGETYTKPIHVEKNTTITAVTIDPDREAPSLAVPVAYLVKGQTKPGLFTAHVGNSLTGTCGSFWRYARTAGYAHHQESFLRPGALTRENWAVATGDYKNDKLANAKETQALKRGTPSWDDYWSKIGKVDLVTLQPRDFDLDKEIAAEISFIRKFREKSPDLQPWLYCEWVEMKRARPSDQGTVPSYQMKKTFPALTWEESMSAMLLYVEELQHRLNPQITDGKPAHIIPSALGMGWIKNMIDHNQVPGVKPGSFYPLLFNDQVHPASGPIHNSANGAYLVDLTWYSAFYREAPEGKVRPIETTFTPEQARLIERLAWDVVKNYPDCGLYEEGKEACGKPKFSNDGKVITLKSSTPGAWFRYTLDGTTPSRTRGYVYCGAISVQPGIRVQAVAYKSGMADSAVTSP
ncbi:chitobiase/beta-hexosaminidase C-terminal domain-containing protein [Prosthecobacter sp.]|uniref:chitobiase/beta-hexosaminidase C-terminal domain-containing protein n=1 Tax=Prosthecobacter sp. TaxID=1965333 RepID=UPI003782E316